MVNSPLSINHKLLSIAAPSPSGEGWGEVKQKPILHPQYWLFN